MFERAALIHYHEIGLKGRNRASFEERLRANVAYRLRGVAGSRVERVASRLLVRYDHPHAREEVLAACAAIPGVMHVSDALMLSRAMGDIRRAAEAVLREAMAAASAPVRTFAVDARRSSTDHPLSGREMNVDIGSHLQGASGLAVDLTRPDVRVHVEVVQGSAYVYARRVPGPGGLPVGTSGTLVALLSAGIDSPVAVWRMMKRGAVVVGVHFSGAPQTSDSSSSDVLDLAAALAPAGGLARLYAVPFGELQRRIALECPPDLRVILYRRLMVRVAEALAGAEHAAALVTGEALGQVASQTLDNIAAIDAAASLPVLRPLVGSDKSEIIDEAMRLGTYEISIRPHDDCCALFMPRTPATHARVAEVEAAESVFDVPAMVAEALEGARRRDLPCAAYRAPRSAPGQVWT